MARSAHDENQRSAFIEAVKKIRKWIAEGDCYQVNMTRTVEDLFIPNPWPIYRQLRTSEAAFGAFLRIRPDLAVLCNSPELLLSGQHPRVVSEPIKGTRPRSPVPADDLAHRADLLSSVKDRAELTMIVDLVRHDLGRIAIPGTVRAGERRVTGHANVWHTSQRVAADLAPQHDVWDALETLFPPGSVTGAPKRRACRRIAELESTPRGVYCGSIGYVSDHGQAAWNVAIRSAVWHAGRARYHVGGGIVFDSNPAEEWQETVDKSTELHRAFHGTDGSSPDATR
jgi:para-aminobenzoate synthetase component 1